MALVIPWGWGHRVDGMEDLSVHCTFAVNRLQTHRLLERVAFEAGYWPSLRGDVPFDLGQPVRSYAGSVFDDPHGFAGAIAQVASNDTVARAMASHRARIVRPSFAGFGDTMRAVGRRDWGGLALRLVAPAGVMIHAEAADGATVAFSDRSVWVHSDALDTFATLADTQPRSLGELPPVGREVDRRADFAAQLVSSGLAVVQPAPD